MSIHQKIREGNLLPNSINAKDFNNIFPAEKILGRKKVGNQYKYLVKIKNFSEEEATWEPVENLYSVLPMLNDFDNSYKPKKRGRKPKFENKENLTEKEEFEKKIDEIVNMESSYLETAPNSKLSNSKNDEENQIETEINSNSKEIIQKTVSEKRKKKTNLQLLIESVPDLKLGQCQMPIKDLFKEPIIDYKEISMMIDKKHETDNAINVNNNNYNIDSSCSSIHKKKSKRVRCRSNSNEASDTSEYIPQIESGTEEISLDETVTEEENEEEINNNIIKTKTKKTFRKEVKKQNTLTDDKLDEYEDQTNLVKCDISLLLPKDNIVPITPTKNPGNINIDIPKKIVYAKNITGKGIYCMVDWKKSKEGKKPEPSYYPSDEIKKRFPDLLLEYYQKRIESNKPREEVKKVENMNFLKKRGRKSFCKN